MSSPSFISKTSPRYCQSGPLKLVPPPPMGSVHELEYPRTFPDWSKYVVSTSPQGNVVSEYFGAPPAVKEAGRYASSSVATVFRPPVSIFWLRIFQSEPYSIVTPLLISVPLSSFPPLNMKSNERENDPSAAVSDPISRRPPSTWNSNRPPVMKSSANVSPIHLSSASKYEAPVCLISFPSKSVNVNS